MLNKKAYLALQAFLVSVFTPLLNKLCSLHGWVLEYKIYSPAISVFLAYYIIVILTRFSFKSFEQSRYERAQNNCLKQIDRQLNMNISEARKQELKELKDEILSRNLNIYQIYLEACQKDLKKSLEE